MTTDLHMVGFFFACFFAITIDLYFFGLKVIIINLQQIKSYKKEEIYV